MQERFINELSTWDLKFLIKGQSEIIKRCVINDIPMVILEYQGFGPTIDPILTECHSVRRKTILQNQKNDGFVNTKLQEVLSSWDVKEIIITGIFADASVKYTAKSALRFGYRVTTSRRLIAEREMYFFHHKRTCDGDWYIENTFFYEKIEGVLDLLNA